MTKSTIGEVMVTEAGCENPYTYKGIFSIGAWRKKALQAFRDREETLGLELWHAPAGGGARRITADDVEWGTSGLKPTPAVLTDVFVSMPDEPFSGDELYVFDTEEAAEAFCDVRGSRHVSSEPILDMKFVDEARRAES